MAPGEFLMREGILFAIHMLLVRWWEYVQIRDCELHFRHHFQTKEHVAFNALLSATYDVVIKLDAEMCIEEGGDKLASMLLLGNRSHLNNASFQSLICMDEDKQ